MKRMLTLQAKLLEFGSGHDLCHLLRVPRQLCTRIFGKFINDLADHKMGALLMRITETIKKTDMRALDCNLWYSTAYTATLRNINASVLSSCVWIPMFIYHPFLRLPMLSRALSSLTEWQKNISKKEEQHCELQQDNASGARSSRRVQAIYRKHSISCVNKAVVVSCSNPKFCRNTWMHNRKCRTTTSIAASTDQDLCVTPKQLHKGFKAESHRRNILEPNQVFRCIVNIDK